MGEYVQHIQELDAYIGGVNDFLKQLTVGLCDATSLSPQEVSNRISKARSYLNTLHEYWSHYRRLREIADMEHEVKKIDYEQEYKSVLYDRDNPIEGENVEERSFRAKEVLASRGIDMVTLKKAEFRASAIKASLDLVERTYKNLDKARADLVVQLRCIQVEKGILYGENDVPDHSF